MIDRHDNSVNRPIRRHPLVAAMLVNMVLLCAASWADQPVALSPPTLDAPKTAGPLQRIVVSGGCFWGVQAVFEHLVGVKKAVAGYAGGEKGTARYLVVSTGRTGHAESVEVSYDPQEVTLGRILQVFFSVAHDPTELNRQGPDVGTQYRSSIFYSDDSQRQIASAYIEQLNRAKVFSRPIVTRLDPLQGFYPAEDYHQDYLLKNPDQPYIVCNDIPKIRAFQRLLPDLYVGRPVTLASAGRSP
jgi:peptide-methionine (S)-S-oxide reductase